jgi:hypothetical protein
VRSGRLSLSQEACLRGKSLSWVMESGGDDGKIPTTRIFVVGFYLFLNI